MRPTEAVRGMIGASGMTMRDVSRGMGRGETFLGSSLGRSGGLSVRTVSEAAAVCGWRLVLTPADDLPPDALVLDPPGPPA